MARNSAPPSGSHDRRSERRSTPAGSILALTDDARRIREQPQGRECLHPGCAGIRQCRSQRRRSPAGPDGRLRTKIDDLRDGFGPFSAIMCGTALGGWVRRGYPNDGERVYGSQSAGRNARCGGCDHPDHLGSAPRPRRNIASTSARSQRLNHQPVRRRIGEALHRQFRHRQRHSYSDQVEVDQTQSGNRVDVQSHLLLGRDRRQCAGWITKSLYPPTPALTWNRRPARCTPRSLHGDVEAEGAKPTWKCVTSPIATCM